MKKFTSGFVLGAAIFTCTTVFAAAAIRVSENNFPIFLWGSPVDVEAYNINDHTYMKLTDVSRIFGVPVAFEDNTVHIGDLNKTNTAYYMPDYSSVPNLEPCIEFPPASIVIEGDHNRIAYYYRLVDKEYKDSLAKFEEILQNDGFQRITNINVKLDFQSKPTNNDVVYNKSNLYVSIEDGGLDDSSLQCVIIRMASGINNNGTGEISEFEAVDNKSDTMPKVISDFTEFYSQTFPLVAAVYDEEAYLYALGFNQGILKYKGFSKAFDWVCTTPRLVLPRMQVFDYDGDGEKEIAVSINAGSGTGLSLDELHIVTPKKNVAGDYDDLMDHKFMPEDYIGQIAKHISYNVSRKDGKMLVNIVSGNSSISGDITDYSIEQSATESDIELAYGSIVGFTPMENGRIELQIDLGARKTGRVEPMYFATLTADIAYKDGSFSLFNIQLYEGMGGV